MGKIVGDRVRRGDRCPGEFGLNLLHLPPPWIDSQVAILVTAFIKWHPFYHTCWRSNYMQNCAFPSEAFEYFHFVCIPGD